MREYDGDITGDGQDEYHARHILVESKEKDEEVDKES